MRATKFEDIHWATWQPRDRATLLFVIREGQILLILKKRGLGQGKINGPGGRLEAGETPLQCAIREVQEELCVTPVDIRERGTLSFQFMDGYSLFGHVFTASNMIGDPQETEEAVPLWFPLHAIPYEKMWSDDILWMPRMLDGYGFSGRFLFDGDQMLGHDIDFFPG